MEGRCVLSIGIITFGEGLDNFTPTHWKKFKLSINAKKRGVFEVIKK